MSNSAAETNQTTPRREVLLAEVGKPLRDFLQTESGSAGLLLVCALFAMAWANSPWSTSYFDLWHMDISVDIGGHALAMSLSHWVNDGLMSIFFFVIGLELRHELSVGELRQKRRVMLPALAAIGGILVPAALYLLVNPSGEAANGWGVVIGTDTAFLLGALALVGPKASTQLRIFLLTATIADDLIAVAIIGLVYSESLDVGMIVIAGACLGAIALLGRLGAWQTIGYVVAGFVAWLATVQSGLHPSIVGMLAGLLVVSAAPERDALDRAAEVFKAFRQAPIPGAGHRVTRTVQRIVSANERFTEILHPWTSYFIVPIFAIANAGVDLRGGVLAHALSSPVTWGVVLGLVAGKPIGISLGVFLGQRLKLGTIPRGIGKGQVIGGGALSGMGFSVSLLIVLLAFNDSALIEEATVGVLLACALSVVTGWLSFRIAENVFGERPATPSMVLEHAVDAGRDHVWGPVDAPLTLVEYGDYECPFCGAATGVVRELKRRYGDELRYVFRHLPLADVHPNAELAAEAAEAAAAQGKFWQMHQTLFQHQSQLEYEDLLGYAAGLDLDVERFARDLNEHRYSGRVREDVQSADASGARRTPTFFVGGHRHIGGWDAERLAQALGTKPRALEIDEV